MKTILILFILGFFTISSSKEFTSISVFHLGNIFPTEINHQHLFTNMNQSRTRYRVYEKLGDYDSIFIDAIPSVGIMHTIIGNKDLNYSNKNSIFTELRTLIKHLETKYGYEFKEVKEPSYRTKTHLSFIRINHSGISPNLDIEIMAYTEGLNGKLSHKSYEKGDIAIRIKITDNRATCRFPQKQLI